MRKIWFVHQKSKAFTLSEVLITLGVIGVVAALTIPGLITANKANRLHSQFLKSYSVLQQVIRLMDEDGANYDPSYYYDNTTSYYKVFGNYLTGATDCGPTTGAYQSNSNVPCYHVRRWSGYNENEVYKTLNGNTAENQWFSSGQWLLPDGTLFLFYTQNKWHPTVITVDINGYKSPPNRLGYDLFTFQFVDGEFKPMGAKGTDFTNMDTYCSETSSNNLNGAGCTVKAKDDSTYFKYVVKKFK